MPAAATFNPPPLAAGSLPADVRLMYAGARALLGLALLVLVASGLAWLLRLPAFALRELKLEGEVAHTSVAAIQAQVLPRLRGGYFDMDLRQTRAVFEDLPWVRRAQVRRVWPRQLVVALEEYRPVAYWERGEGREPLLVDRHGEVFEVNLGDLDDEALPVLRGPNAEAAPQLWAMWQRLAPEFEALGGARLMRLALSDGGSWQARLDRAQAVIELGRGDPDELVQRTRRFVQSVPAVSAQFQQRPVQYADLRHRDGYALRLLGVGIAEPKGPARR